MGVVAFTTNLLAERSGIRIRTIYRYFPSKLGILTALTVRLYNDIADPSVTLSALMSMTMTEMGRLRRLYSRATDNRSA